MSDSLKKLFNKTQQTNLSTKQRQIIICQQVLISKICNNNFANNAVIFKGGVILNSLAKGKRGFTKDVDFDFVKFPISYDGVKSFFEMLNTGEVFHNIVIKIDCQLIHINTNEQMIAEKLSTFAIFGLDNTRYKDFFDAYWLIANTEYDRTKIVKYLKKILRTNNSKYSYNEAIREMIGCFSNENYISSIEKTGNNWVDTKIKTICDELIAFTSTLK